MYIQNKIQALIIKVKWSRRTCFYPILTDTYLYVDYIFLDTAERRRFAQVQHEYLIEQTHQSKSFNIPGDTTPNVTFNFNHPVKELVWVVQPETFTTNAFTQPAGGHQWFNYTD